MKVSDLKSKLVSDLESDRVFYKYKHLLLVGENNSGKSNVLKGIIGCLKDNNVYFIDSTNRNITSKREEIQKGFEDFSIKDIIETRLKVDNFNKKDVFSDNDGSEIVLNELFVKFEEYKQLFEEVLGINLEKTTETMAFSGIENEEIILVNGDRLDNVSDGIQAMARMLMEVNYANSQNCIAVFIDEMNMNLDHKNSWEFIEKLKLKYPTIKFILTCHSLYTVLGIEDFDVIKIIKFYRDPDSNLIEVYDSNDLDNVEIIDRKLFGVNKGPRDLDRLLSNSAKMVVVDQELSEQMIQELQTLSFPNLSIRQKVILNFIKERSGKL